MYQIFLNKILLFNYYMFLIIRNIFEKWKKKYKSRSLKEKDKNIKTKSINALKIQQNGQTKQNFLKWADLH